MSNLYDRWRNDHIADPSADKQVVNMEVLLKTLDLIVDNLSSNMPPVGSFYTQYTNSAGQFVESQNPNNMYPLSQWTQRFAGEGLFFRTSGVDDLRNSSTGIQPDRIRNIIGVTAGYGSTVFRTDTSYPKGALNYGDPFPSTSQGASVTGTTAYSTIGLDANGDYNSTNINPMAGHANGADIAPKNRLVRIWERVA